MRTPGPQYRASQAAQVRTLIWPPRSPSPTNRTKYREHPQSQPVGASWDRVYKPALLSTPSFSSGGIDTAPRHQLSDRKGSSESPQRHSPADFSKSPSNTIIGFRYHLVVASLQVYLSSLRAIYGPMSFCATTYRACPGALSAPSVLVLIWIPCAPMKWFV